MKMPILLSGHTMAPAQMLRPQSMQITLRADGLSGASMVLDDESPDVPIGSWVQVWAPNGEMTVMYVKSRKRDYTGGTMTITLEHTFGMLAEMVVFGEVTPETMSGTEGATTCTVTQAITYLLGQQTENLWQLDECDFSDAQGWKFTNSDIYNDLNSLTDAIIDCQWEFDQESLPWKVSLKEWPTSSTMEMRRSRNLDTLQITLDKSGMYTRVYPTGKNNLHIDEVNSNVSYLDQNTATYGVIANVITDSSIGDAGLLKAWAQKQLDKNSRPKVSVKISGYELSMATGESMDRLTIGRLCRIPLPEYGETVTERLTELAWRDAIMNPEAVNCTLANELKTVTGILNEQARGGGGGSKKANTAHDCELEEEKDKIEEFDNADIWINRDSVWAVCAQYDVITQGDDKHVRLKEGALLEIYRDGIYETVGSIISDQDTQIGLLDDWIDDFEGSALWTQQDNITAVCGEYSVVNYTEEGVRKKKLKINNGTGLVLTRNDTEYGVYDSGNLTAGIIVDKINGGTVSINAEHIELDGATVAASLYSENVEVQAFEAYGEVVCHESLDCGSIDTATIVCDDVDTDTITIDGSAAEWKSITVRNVTLSNSHAFRYESTTGASYGTVNGRIVTGSSDTTIYYLGKTQAQQQ